jgi:hypothetical protein
MANLATAPQSIGGVLDTGFRLFSTSLKQVFLLAAANALLFAPLTAVTRSAFVEGGSGAIGRLVVTGILLVIVALVVWGAILVRLDAAAHDRTVRVGDAFSIGLRRAPALIIAGVLYSCASVIGLLLLIPGLIIMVYWVFGPIATVTESLGAIASLGYSFKLVRGQWWRATTLLTIISILALVIDVIVDSVGGLVANIDPLAQSQVPWYIDLIVSQTPWYIDFIVNPLISGVADPLLYSLMLATFYDLQLRHEGVDLAERIAAT